MFVGRESELSRLKKLLSTDESRLAAVYGRRRIGKTALIRHAFDSQKTFFFEGLEHQNTQAQLANFVFQLEIQTQQKVKEPVKNWREAFALLLPHIPKDQRLVIVLDELQWMANDRSTLISDLKMMWDQYISLSGKVVMVLCGSIASFMIKKVVRSKALYGRIHESIHLLPFSLSETQQLLSQKVQRGHEEIFLAHAMLGGIPMYLKLVNEHSSVLQGINTLAFEEDGYLKEEYARIFTSHFGQHHAYEQIIALLAKHPYGLTRSQIIERLNLSAGGDVTRLLFNLNSAAFIDLHAPILNQRKKDQRYYLSDFFLRFYFAFMQSRNTVSQPFHQQAAHSSAFYAFLGRSFELICLQHHRKIAGLLGFSGVNYEVGHYYQAAKHREDPPKDGVEIDIAFKRADHVVTLCEVKYTRQAPGVDVGRAMQDKIARLELGKQATVHPVLITKIPPSTELLRQGDFASVITLDDLLD